VSIFGQKKAPDNAGARFFGGWVLHDPVGCVDDCPHCAVRVGGCPRLRQVVYDNSVITASNVKVCVTLGGVEVDTLRVVGDVFHDSRLNLSGFEPRENFTAAGAVVALGEVFVAKRRVTNCNVKKHSL
tara:strand:- start:309 stop:692 length:384 start_codon:yes stop_codon:yes gene_type:complete